VTDPLYFNRELSWLQFNARVLNEALDSRTPLLERLKFIAIHGNNLDEFYMVRVAGLRRQLAAGVTQPAPDGLSPAEQLAAIHNEVAQQHARAEACLVEVLGELAERGIRLLGIGDLTPDEWTGIDAYFESTIFPILTPLALDPAHPFPHISNLSLSLAVEIRDPTDNVTHFARVKVPRSLPRWVAVPGRARQFVPLEQVIGANLGALFPGMEILGSYAFRVTRYTDLELAGTDEPEDLLATIEEQVFRRGFGEVVRLEVQPTMPAHLRELLLEELRGEDAPGSARLGESDVRDAGALLELSALHSIASLDVPELHDPPFVSLVPAAFRDAEASIFDVIRESDVLVHHPYDSFTASVERFFITAAEDSDVLAIKTTLYRTSGDTPIVDALTHAAQHGKQVAVIVELKARFDEANNISWARRLEDYGVHVSYGSASLKTHAKTALVVRREGEHIRRYVHIGSGNYNSKTARGYTDLGLFTVDPTIASDVSDLFNSLTGYSRQRRFRRLIVAPLQMREQFIGLIEREAARARDGRPARIVAKMNALVDPKIIEALYAASRDGVEIDLIVRGICCLRAGVPGLSERIRVVSIIGRFLEHSRAWWFANGGADDFYIGSADWMQRNFDRRVEAVTPVDQPALHVPLRRLFEACLTDNRQAWDLMPDGRWVQRHAAPGEADRGTQAMLLHERWEAATLAARPIDKAAAPAEH